MTDLTAAPPAGGLDGVRACVFDAYGTLFDVSAAARHLQDDLGPAWEGVSALWRQKQLEYTWLRSLMRDYADFRVVTADALDYALATHGITNRALTEQLLALYDRLDAYAEVPDVLSRLRAAGKQTAILSNGSPDMLASAVKNAGIGALLDDSLSVDGLRIYKPDPAVYALATERFGLQPHQIAFFSSNGWDAAGAASFGFRVVWVNRFNQRRERLPAQPEAEVRTLTEAATLIAP